MKNIKKLDFLGLSEAFKVLGHPVRLKIVCGLVAQKACVTDIYKCLNMPQATVSQHLSLLRNKGILKAERDGVRMQYHVVNKDVIKLVNTLLKKR